MFEQGTLAVYKIGCENSWICLYQWWWMNRIQGLLLIVSTVIVSNRQNNQNVHEDMWRKSTKTILLRVFLIWPILVPPWNKVAVDIKCVCSFKVVEMVWKYPNTFLLTASAQIHNACQIRICVKLTSFITWDTYCIWVIVSTDDVFKTVYLTCMRMFSSCAVTSLICMCYILPSSSY